MGNVTMMSNNIKHTNLESFMWSIPVIFAGLADVGGAIVAPVVDVYKNVTGITDARLNRDRN